MRISLWSGIAILVGVGFSVAAIFSFRDSLRVRNRYIGMPVKVSLSLTPAEMNSPEFVAEKGIYDIEIVSHGAVISGKNTDISWTISDQGRAVAQGDSSQSQGSDGGNRVIGTFRPERNGRYTLHVTVRTLAPTSISGALELMVIPDIGERDDIAMGAGFLELEALICGVVGLVVLSVAIVKIRGSRSVAGTD